MSDRLASGATTNTRADFLLELLSEEIPARMQAKARNDLARMFAEELDGAGLTTEGIETFATPRRLALIARGLPLETTAVSEELKGPRTSAPDQAIDGFLKKTELSRENLVERDGIYFAVIDKPGRATSAVLAEAVERIVGAFPWPKSMRWGAASTSTSSLRWVRPLQGIVALLGEEIVPVEIDGIAAGAATLGHRFHHPGTITIGGAHDYVEKLRACHVIVDPEERETLVRDGAREAATAAGLTLVEDEGLVVENAGLTEWPVPLLGRFDPDFLDVPREVIVLTMRTNQKYFACTGEDGGLAPAFVCTANIDANDGGEAIIEGNRRVLAARLADARFFWEQDLKVPLEEQAKKLGGIIFHEKLGTVADKVERVAKLARWLVEEGIVTASPRHSRESGNPASGKGSGTPASAGVTKELADQAERAARLAKADLVTGMVGEFPELQGVIGGYLAAAQGEPPEVAAAIRDHYKPVGQGDEVPTAPVTVAVALADKLDTIREFYRIGEKPTGSKDPYALRRGAIGIAQLVLGNNLPFKLVKAMTSDFPDGPRQLIEKTVLSEAGIDAAALARSFKSFDEQWKKTFRNLNSALEAFTIKMPEIQAPKLRLPELEFPKIQGPTRKLAEFGSALTANTAAISEALSFVADRLKVQQREAGVRHDLIDAVFALGGEDDFVRLLARVKALQSFVETGEGADLLAGYKRAANILKREKWDASASGGADVLPDEAALVSALNGAEPLAEAAIVKEDFTAAMGALASLRGPIDAFFDKVTVNDADAGVRARRLNLLARFRDAVHRVADFSKIEG